MFATRPGAGRIDLCPTLMSIDEYFSQPPSDVFDRNGQETEWFDIGTIEVISGRLAVGDNTFFAQDQLAMDIKPGQYSVQAKVRDFGTDRRVSRLRAFQAAAPFVSRLKGQISVSFNSLTVCEPAAFLAALLMHTEGGHNRELAQALYGSRLEDAFGTITWLDELPATMAFVPCGWGSGSYDVLALIADTIRVGMEVIFIEPLESYIFQNASEFDIIYVFIRLAYIRAWVVTFIVSNAFYFFVFQNNYVNILFVNQPFTRDECNIFPIERPDNILISVSRVISNFEQVTSIPINNIDAIISITAQGRVKSRVGRVWSFGEIDRRRSSVSDSTRRASRRSAHPTSAWAEH
jgi:hypothetical protein